MDDHIPTKRCSRCGEEKPLQMFHKNKNARDGFQSKCKPCVSQYSKAHYSANIEKYREKNRINYAANADARRSYNRAYRIAYSEQKRESDRIYRAANKEKIREQTRKYRATHVLELRQMQRAYRAVHREQKHKNDQKYRQTHRDVDRAYNHRRRARIRGNGDYISHKQISDLRALQAGICAYCQYQHNPDALEIDHIIPIAQGRSHKYAQYLPCLPPLQ